MANSWSGDQLLLLDETSRPERARKVWLETSNVNVPGIAANARLGDVPYGGDATEYDTLEYPDEAALHRPRSVT